ncbi:hypothetical protein KY385_00990 [Candidatus Parcubacteria bacterium]|nr:hypothetical protein [Candidatus Parcubacteria bacterium]
MFSLTSDKEGYDYGDTAAFQATVTNISPETITKEIDQDCADPILLINDTKLESPECQRNESEIVLEPGNSVSWQWSYKILEPDADARSTQEVALKAGKHELSSLWLGEPQESVEFSVD